MKRISFLIIMVLFVSFSWAKKHSKKPNIIIIVADDLGYSDLSCYGSKDIKTPNIDRLANNGVRLIDFHTNGTVCSPTRSALLTGKYQQRTSVSEIVTVWDRDHGLDLEEITFAEQLKKAGYTTGICGKWHLGYKTMYNPINQGFDLFNGYVSGNIDYHGHQDYRGFMDWWTQDEIQNEEGYSTDLITKYALRFIDSNKDKPFLLYIPHEAPHGPFQGRKDMAFRKTGQKVPDKKRSYDTTRLIYKEMVEVMDEGIGKVMASLKKNNLEKNTIVFFFSDNGGAKYAKNAPLRGGKSSVYEGGHRVPCIVSWKGKLKQIELDQTLMTMDIYPTITNLAGIENDHFIDGQDIMGVLSDGEKLNQRDLFWEWRGKFAMRRGNYKLILYPNKNVVELYNLKEDIAEKNNIAVVKPELVAEMKLATVQWFKSVSNQ
ncbi:sulfatase [Halosquirtibacter xylanolyticus]|uniref:sulfatase n=1 Tax=Halosquirtibacter xylanolyticus TaxID=3374599 RepID=UPI00374A2AD6|nr:sulfatase [Prolixibacteraceae bacterium]